MPETIHMPDEAQLLSDLIRTGSQSAFEQIVNKHIHLVYASAMRQVRDAHLAEDITQAVFVLLWQRAGSLRDRSSLGGWLLATTHNISRNAMKKEWRLKRRERKVAEMNEEKDPSLPAELDPALPLLDAAMAQLSTIDRDVIVERFFRSRSLEEVGMSVGLSQQAAAKRLSRALVKLRGILARHGVTASEASLSAWLPIVAMKPGASAALLSTVLASPAATASSSVTALAHAAARPWYLSFMHLAVTGAVVVALGGVGYLALAPGKAPPAPAIPLAAVDAPAAAVNGQRIVTISLVDAKTHDALAGGTVELEINRNSATPQPAGADGKYVLNLPGNIGYARAICRAPGYAAMSLEFQDATFKGDLATDYTVPMQTVTTIGGIVTDEAGNPLAGATVRLSTYSDGQADAARIYLNERIRTDAGGKWHFDAAPSKLDHLYLEVTHPKFPRSQGGSQMSADELHHGTFAMVMKNLAGQIDGAVLDPDGKPVAGAKVVIAQDRYESDKPTASTDDDGKFSINRPGTEWDTYATVTARGYAPEQVQVPGTRSASMTPGKAGSKPLQIRLSRPVVLTGTVVDENGKPVRGATVEIEQWRNNRALQWSSKTNGDGQFTWEEAPADKLQLNVRRNESQLSGVEVTAGKPNRLTLYPPVQIVGEVRDADTQEPMPAFRITYGIRWTGQDDVTWQPMSSRKLGNGKYEARISQFSNGGKIKVEADGYLPIVSRMIQGNEGTIRLDFELQRGSGPSGVVLSPDGKPVVDVRVVCVPAGSNLYIDPEHDNLANQTNIALAQTDKDGHFALQPQDKKFSLVVIADEGFALIKDDDFAKDNQIHLRKWARIEGDYRLNAGVAKSVKMSVQAQLVIGSDNPSNFRLPFVSTDDKGHFACERVPPDQDVRLYRVVPLGGGSERYLQMGVYKTSSGQTTTVHIGGKGRPVIGKLSLPASASEPVDIAQQVNVSVVPGGDQSNNFLQMFTFPENFPDMTEIQQQQWVQNQMKANPSLQAKVQKAEHADTQLPAEFAVTSDGTMRADDVEPGTYQIYVSLQEKYQPGRNHVEQLGSAKLTFTVPATPACPTDEPLDIGVVQMQRAQTLAVKNPLPDVELVTLDGKPIEASAWAGNVVVMHIWDMHNRQFFPVIHQLDEKYKDGKVQIVNVGSQMLPAWAKHIDGEDHLPGLLALEKDSASLNMQAAYMNHAWTMTALPKVLILDGKHNLAAIVTDPQQLMASVEAQMNH